LYIGPLLSRHGDIPSLLVLAPPAFALGQDVPGELYHLLEGFGKAVSGTCKGYGKCRREESILSLLFGTMRSTRSQVVVVLPGTH
jgi:hypothetical protein